MSKPEAMQSMTGFGRGTAVGGGTEVTCEIRAVNARSADVRIKLPRAYRDAEQRLHAELAAVASRGKVDVVVERRSASGVALEEGIDATVFQHFREQLLALVPELANDAAGLARAVLTLPGVVGSVNAEPTDAEREALAEAFRAALQAFLAFRSSEGASLGADLLGHVATIEDSLPNIAEHEESRERTMRQRLDRLVAEKLAGTAIDRARLEQECLFYLEKMDISEEKTRLAQHCAYFRDNLLDEQVEKGRRLSFIAQEMGREINTLGAKAYASEIQRVVVTMKEALEKIKEQLANAV